MNMKIIKEKNNIRITKLEIDVAKIGHITNTYIVQDMKTNVAVLIDPAFDPKYILSCISELNVNLLVIILTHAHADHFGALKGILDKFKQGQKKLDIYIHELDLSSINDKLFNEADKVGLILDDINIDDFNKLSEGSNIILDSMSFEVIHTPGHTKGSIMLYEKTSDTLFSGDTIFKNTYGRTDLLSGNSKQMKESIDKIFYRFDDIDVFPGHDDIFKLDESKRKIKLIYAFKG